ncbi:YifB family Mg chelatase-like AAA ATPase [Methylonatrum kenyense]|uniref:YifB family Mg chelatase-like AAA ATPase n=1 Tax=Methylonatrum kenyense TaxID=455253 RepID=UPI0020C13248|nr:YifB family Mg chelatase-like AAA ATPase [Methylonatrum kenyense]MCK8515193.1 YifB family Mg chelatase-like AAA ATPase [Methylonatrum kenyense]
MALAITLGRAEYGIQAPLVTIETHLANGLPAFSIVGLAETAVKESRDRVRSAIVNSGFEFPARRITVNLAPADLPKHGGRFDLPIALGILAASGQVPADDLERVELAGELSLGGRLRGVSGILPAAVQARAANRELILAEPNAGEASLVHPNGCRAASHLLEVCGHFAGENPLPVTPHSRIEPSPSNAPDLADVRGQSRARRALEIAAAGRHNLLLAGPPGTGKSMLAARLAGILPTMSEVERLETASVHSLSHEGFAASRWGWRPFRAPHHSASHVALAGGGRQPRPGEISLAHNGVLFLDELPEFSRQSLEILREPLECGEVTISRAANQVIYPARFQLIAAMNPCPCGFLGDPVENCRCAPEQISRYRSRLSGPLLDRIDLHVEVNRLPAEALQDASPAEPSNTVAERVRAAYQRRMTQSGKPSADLGAKQLESACALGPAETQFARGALEQMRLSARGYHRLLRVARTIADLGGEARVSTESLSEALSYRRLPMS